MTYGTVDALKKDRTRIAMNLIKAYKINNY